MHLTRIYRSFQQISIISWLRICYTNCFKIIYPHQLHNITPAPNQKQLNNPPKFHKVSSIKWMNFFFYNPANNKTIPVNFCDKC